MTDQNEWSDSYSTSSSGRFVRSQTGGPALWMPDNPTPWPATSHSALYSPSARARTQWQSIGFPSFSAIVTAQQPPRLTGEEIMEEIRQLSPPRSRRLMPDGTVVECAGAENGCRICNELRDEHNQSAELETNGGDIIDQIDQLERDEIDDLVDAQLQQEASGYDHNINQEKCWHCGRHWHGLPLTQRVADMYQIGIYDERYAAAQDVSRIVCPGSDFIGPMPTAPIRRLTIAEAIAEFLRSATDLSAPSDGLCPCGCGVNVRGLLESLEVPTPSGSSQVYLYGPPATRMRPPQRLGIEGIDTVIFDEALRLKRPERSRWHPRRWREVNPKVWFAVFLVSWIWGLSLDGWWALASWPGQVLGWWMWLSARWYRKMESFRWLRRIGRTLGRRNR